MPELPEVETVRLQLLHKVKGRTINDVKVYHQKTVGHDARFAAKLRGKTISHIDRIGKLMIFEFAGQNNLFMLAHLKMTGQFFFRAKGRIAGGGHTFSKTDTASLPSKHTRVEFIFANDSHLFFNDMRLFGYTKLVNRVALESISAGYGPEPIDEDFPFADFSKRLRKRHTSIKAALLDQSFVAGLGNIYVDEALFKARVRPTRRADRITNNEARLIIETSRAVMRQSLTVGGTTFQHFVDTGGENGNYTDYLLVFGKQNNPCSVCATPIKKIRCAGRGTHFCPKCQK